MRSVHPPLFPRTLLHSPVETWSPQKSMNTHTAILLPRFISLLWSPLIPPFKMLPNPLPQRQQLLRRLNLKTRMPRRLELILSKRDMDLLSLRRDIEPRQCFFLEDWNGNLVEAERGPIEGCGLVECSEWDQEVYVRYACDHFAFCVGIVVG